MNFIKHSNLSGHAPFSPSQPAWLRYDDDKAIKYLIAKKASERGTRLHAWAKETIDMKIKQPRSKKTLYSYVNDAIGFRMDTEVVLYYSPNFLGTADSICFRDNVLRIHDLKTGTGQFMRNRFLYMQHCSVLNIRFAQAILRWNCESIKMMTLMFLNQQHPTLFQSWI